MQSLPQTQQAPGTLDGQGAGDSDQAYVFGRRPRSNATGPFTIRQYSRLLVLRSRVQAGLCGTDGLGLDVQPCGASAATNSKRLENPLS
jgi:hypothetical protein